MEIIYSLLVYYILAGIMETLSIIVWHDLQEWKLHLKFFFFWPYYFVLGLIRLIREDV